MTWLQLLYKVQIVITLIVDVAVLRHVFPAFQRTKNKAFLLIAISFGLGIFDTIFNYSITSQDLRGASYIVFRIVPRLFYLVGLICLATGLALLTRQVLHVSGREESDDDSEAENPPHSN